MSSFILIVYVACQDCYQCPLASVLSYHTNSCKDIDIVSVRMISRVGVDLFSATLLAVVWLVTASATFQGGILVLARSKASLCSLLHKGLSPLCLLICWYSVYTPSVSFFDYALTAPELLWAGCPDGWGNVYRSLSLSLLIFSLSLLGWEVLGSAACPGSAGWLFLKRASHSSNIFILSLLASANSYYLRRH